MKTSARALAFSFSAFQLVSVLLLTGCANHAPQKSVRSAAAAALPALPSVTLAWTASPSPQVTGYALHSSAVRVPGSEFRTDVGPVLTFTLTDLLPATEYRFHATAYDGNGLESLPSNTVLYQTPAPPLPPGDLLIVITPQRADSIAGPWLAVTAWPALTLTNPVGQHFYRLDIK